MEDERRWEIAAGVFATVVVFVIALFILLKVFELELWGELPALLALGVPLASAWVLAVGVGRDLMPLGLLLALATACLLVAAPLVYWQLGVPEGGEGGGPPVVEEVLFKYEASFTYLSSAENKPLRGYGILFPCPTVHGKPVITKENLRWQLWGPGENGELVLEVDNGKVIRWVGERANSPPDNDFYFTWSGRPFHEHSWREWFGTTWKIIIQNNFDNLYKGEMLRSEGYFILPAENANSVTLHENDGSILADPSWLNNDEVPFATIRFWVRLLKRVNNNFEEVKQYSRVKENVPETAGEWLELYES